MNEPLQLPAHAREVLIDYSEGRLSRAVAMDRLGLDWYGDLQRLLGAAGLSMPLVSDELRAEQVAGMLRLLMREG